MPLSPEQVHAVDQYAAFIRERADTRGIDLRSKEVGFAIGLMLTCALQVADDCDGDELMRTLFCVGLSMGIAAGDRQGVEWVQGMIDRWEARR